MYRHWYQTLHFIKLNINVLFLSPVSSQKKLCPEMLKNIPMRIEPINSKKFIISLSSTELLC
jgi:hypothetical protein